MSWRVALGVVLLGGLLSSCAPTTLYNWRQYDESLYNYVKNPTEENVDKLLNELSRHETQRDGIRKLPAPGICVDYGYLLIKSGKVEEGKRFMLLEVELYPESKVLVDKVLKRIGS